MDAHVLDAGQTRVSALAGPAVVASSGVSREAAGARAGLVPVVVVLVVGKQTGAALLLVVGVVVRMVVGMIVVVMVVVGVTVAVAAEDKEADKVGEEASGTDDEHQLGVGDLLGLDESGQGFEDDGDAEGDEEDGVEEGTEDLSTHPLMKD